MENPHELNEARSRFLREHALPWEVISTSNIGLSPTKMEEVLRTYEPLLQGSGDQTRRHFLFLGGYPTGFNVFAYSLHPEEGYIERRVMFDDLARVANPEMLKEYVIAGERRSGLLLPAFVQEVFEFPLGASFGRGDHFFHEVTFGVDQNSTQIFDYMRRHKLERTPRS